MSEPVLIRVVDDDPDVRDALIYMLRFEGWEVAAFENAASFLAGDVPSRRGVLILDVKMPGMSGLSLQDELLKRQYPNPIIFLTGHGDIGMAVSAVKKGAVNFLQKPINAPELIKVIKESLKSSSQEIPKQKALAAIQALSEREREIIGYLIHDLSNAQIAERLGISVRTVEHYRQSAYYKLGVHNLDELVEKFGEILTTES
ncbi:MAG: DNA-binding response regulator [Burkholderia sp.]|jgi:two-component system, LuxR family, response regulator TtrR